VRRKIPFDASPIDAPGTASKRKPYEPKTHLDQISDVRMGFVPF
jgi:hypothetical protein